jgi:hypothetical protein
MKHIIKKNLRWMWNAYKIIGILGTCVLFLNLWNNTKSIIATIMAGAIIVLCSSILIPHFLKDKKTTNDGVETRK